MFNAVANPPYPAGCGFAGFCADGYFKENAYGDASRTSCPATHPYAYKPADNFNYCCAEHNAAGTPGVSFYDTGMANRPTTCQGDDFLACPSTPCRDFFQADVCTACTAVTNAASVTCTSASDSVAASAAAGYFMDGVTPVYAGLLTACTELTGATTVTCTSASDSVAASAAAGYFFTAAAGVAGTASVSACTAVANAATSVAVCFRIVTGGELHHDGYLQVSVESPGKQYVVVAFQNFLNNQTVLNACYPAGTTLILENSNNNSWAGSVLTSSSDSASNQGAMTEPVCDVGCTLDSQYPSGIVCVDGNSDTYELCATVCGDGAACTFTSPAPVDASSRLTCTSAIDSRISVCPSAFPYHVTNDVYGWAGLLCFNTPAEAGNSIGPDGSYCILQAYEADSRAIELVGMVNDPLRLASYCNILGASSSTPCAVGYYHTVTVGMVADMCTVCDAVANAATVICTAEGNSVAARAAAGYFMAGANITACTEVPGAATVTCYSASDSVAASAAAGYFMTGDCDEVTWPDVDDAEFSGICGECKVLVHFGTGGDLQHSGTCAEYCLHVGVEMGMDMHCVAAWEDVSGEDSCNVDHEGTCEQPVLDAAGAGTSDGICECGLGGGGIGGGNVALTACTAVTNAEVNSTLACTSAYDSRLIGGCAGGYHLSVGVSNDTDACDSCSAINMTDTSVSSCSECVGGTESNCSAGACAAGYHTYDVSTATCTACTAVAKAASTSCGYRYWKMEITEGPSTGWNCYIGELAFFASGTSPSAASLGKQLAGTYTASWGNDIATVSDGIDSHTSDTSEAHMTAPGCAGHEITFDLGSGNEAEVLGMHMSQFTSSQNGFSGYTISSSADGSSWTAVYVYDGGYDSVYDAMWTMTACPAVACDPVVEVAEGCSVIAGTVVEEATATTTCTLYAGVAGVAATVTAGIVLSDTSATCETAGYSSATTADQCQALAEGNGEDFSGNVGSDMPGCMRYQDGSGAAVGWSFSSSGQGSGAECAGSPNTNGYECLCDPNGGTGTNTTVAVVVAAAVVGSCAVATGSGSCTYVPYSYIGMACMAVADCGMAFVCDMVAFECRAPRQIGDTCTTAMDCPVHLWMMCDMTAGSATEWTCIAMAGATVVPTLECGPNPDGVTCTNEYDSTLTRGCVDGYYATGYIVELMPDECHSCSHITMHDSSVVSCSACTGANEDDCFEATCAAGYHTYDTSSATCTSCTAVANADPGSAVTCTNEFDSYLGGLCAAGHYFVSASNVTDVADACVACSTMNMTELTVSTCSVCTGSTESSCSDANCAPGHHTYDSTTGTCTACTGVANADVNSTLTCTSEYDSHVSACASGYYLLMSNDSTADASWSSALDDDDFHEVAEGCSVIAGTVVEEATAATTCTLYAGVASVAGVAATNTTIAVVGVAAVVGSCAVATGSGSCTYIPFSAVVPMPESDECVACNDFRTESSVFQCLSCRSETASDCDTAECSRGFHTYAAGACSPCSLVLNAAQDAVYNCTSEYDSDVSHCSPGYTHVHHATQGGMCMPMETCATFQCAAFGMVHIAAANSTLWPAALQPPRETCCVHSCLRPLNATGYNLTRVTELLAADLALFSVSGLECAAGYKGIPEALPCAHVDLPVAVRGRRQLQFSGGDPTGVSCSTDTECSADGSLVCDQLSYTCMPDTSAGYSTSPELEPEFDHSSEHGLSCSTDTECSTDGSLVCDQLSYTCMPDTSAGYSTEPSTEPALESFPGGVANEPALEPLSDPSLGGTAGGGDLPFLSEMFLLNSYYGLKGCWLNNAPIPCEAPFVAIETASPITIRPSTAARVRATGSLAKCDAPAGSGLRFLWTANTLAGQAIGLDPVITRSNTSQLILSPFLFAAGIVQLRVESWLSSNRAANTTSTPLVVIVEATPYVTALIAGGSFRKVDTSSELFFDASSSEDPDDANVVWDSVTWSCVNVTVPAVPVDCWGGSFSLPVADKAGNVPLLWNLTERLRTSEPGVMTFSVLLVSGGRNDSASVDVEVVSIPVPSVSILDVQSKYSPSNRVVLQSAASTADVAAGYIPALSYMWSGWPCLNAACVPPDTPFDLLPLTSTPLENRILVVKQNTLPSGSTYRFRLEVNDGRATGVCQVDVVVNIAPTGGTVAITPNEGLAVTDNFQITADGWSDEDIPLTYRFFYAMSVAGSADLGALSPLTEASNSKTTTSILAVGQEASNFAYTVFVAVMDAYDARADASTSVTVRPYVPSANIAEDASNLLAAAATSDNVQATTQLVGAFAASLNVEEEEPEAGAPALTQAEIDEYNAQAAATRALLADAMLNIVSSAGAEGGVELTDDVKEAVAAGLSGVTANPYQMTTESLDSSFDAVKMLTEGGQGPSAAAVDSLAAATSNLLQATSSGSMETTAAQAEEYSAATLNIVEQLSKALVSDAMPGEEPSSVSTDSFDISSQKNFADSFAGAPLPIGGANRRRYLADGIDIVVPEGAFDGTEMTGDSAVDAMVTAWAANPYGFADTSNLTADFGEGSSEGTPMTMGTSVLGMSFAADGEELDMHDLDNPFVMSLAPGMPLNDSQVAYCSHWNVTKGEWVVDTRFGPGNITEDGGIVCQFDHLTDFSAFVGPPPAFNKPCFSCLDQLWSNPAGLFVVISCGSLLIFVFVIGVARYVRFSHYTPKEILAMKFAIERVKVMSPDEDYMSSCSEDISHRIRHDYSCGGIFCQIPGDPFDWSQRFLVFHTTLIMSLCVSLLLFRPNAGEPECKEECTQLTEDAPLECEMVCNEVEKNGIYVSVVSAMISTPIVVLLGILFTWLRKPVVGAIEPEKVSILSAVKVVACCFDTKDAHLGAKFMAKMNDAEKYITGDDEKVTRVAGGRNKSVNVLVVDRAAFTIDSDSSDEEERLAPPPAPMMMAELRVEVARAQSRWRQQEQGQHLPKSAFFTPGQIPEENKTKGGAGLNDLSLMPGEDDDERKADRSSPGERGGMLPPLGRHGPEHLPIPWLDGENPTGDDDAQPVPRKWYWSLLPFLYSLVFGCGGLLIIASVAAGLGKENTINWLMAALMSLVMKVFIVDPVKVIALTAFLQYAEDYNRDTLAKGLEEKARAVAAVTMDTAKEAAQAATDAALKLEHGVENGILAGVRAAKKNAINTAKVGAAGALATGAVVASQVIKH